MTVRNLDRLFEPASVALIGASNRPLSPGAVIARNLRSAGFAGPIMLVNPKYAEIDGAACHPDVASLPATPDLAVVVTPPPTVPAIIAELGARGTKAAVVITAGFGEGGAERGHALRQAMLDAARPHLLRIVGPNCLGVMVPGHGLNATFAHLAATPGRLAFVTQSGAVMTGILDWASGRGIGFSHLVSLGDMADVDFGDLLDYLAQQAATSAILLYMEAVTHARKFMSAARAASRRKPVIVLKAGRHAEGARAVASHTGALAGVGRGLWRRVPARRHAARALAPGAVRRRRDPGHLGAPQRRPPRHLEQRRRLRGDRHRRADRGGRPSRRARASHARAPERGAARHLEPRQSGRHHRRRAGPALPRCLEHPVRGSGPGCDPGAELPDRRRFQHRCRRGGGGRGAAPAAPTSDRQLGRRQRCPSTRPAACSGAIAWRCTTRRGRRCSPSCTWSATATASGR